MPSLCGHSVGGCLSRPRVPVQHRLGLPAALHLAIAQPSRSSVVAAAQQAPQHDSEAQDKRLAAISLGISLGGGLLLSQFGVDEALPEWSQQASSALGWSYVLAWSISFYPQVRAARASELWQQQQ